jgi:predicted nucleic acid-binding protein
VLSIQVLQEFFVNVTRRMPRSLSSAFTEADVSNMLQGVRTFLAIEFTP